MPPDIIDNKQYVSRMAEKICGMISSSMDNDAANDEFFEKFLFLLVRAFYAAIRNDSDEVIELTMSLAEFILGHKPGMEKHIQKMEAFFPLLRLGNAVATEGMKSLSKINKIL